MYSAAKDRASHKGRAISAPVFPTKSGIFPDLSRARSSAASRNQRLDGQAAVAGDDTERAAQRQNALAHADEAEAELLIRAPCRWPLSLTRTRAQTRPSRAPAAGRPARSATLTEVAPAWRNTLVSASCTMRWMVRSAVSPVAPSAGEIVVSITTSGCDSRHSRNSDSKRPAQAEFGEADGAQPLQHAAVELLQRVESRSSKALPCFRTASARRPSVRELRQRAGMRAQRKQIRPEFVVQLARDLLALDVLERDRPLGEAPLVLDRLAERCRQMVELGADRGELRRAARCDARLIMSAFDLSPLPRPATAAAPARRPTTFIITRNSASAIAEPTSSWVTMPSQISAISSSGCEVIRKRAGLAVDRDRHPHRGLLGMDQADEPGRRPRVSASVSSGGRRLRVAPGIPKRDADMAQAAEIARDLVQPAHPDRAPR